MFRYLRFRKNSINFQFPAGYYAYIEASNPRVNGDNAKLVVPNYTGSVCLRFYRHMYGLGIGTLRIKVNGAIKLERTGYHGNKWIADAVDILGINSKVNKSSHQVNEE